MVTMDISPDDWREYSATRCPAGQRGVLTMDPMTLALEDIRRALKLLTAPLPEAPDDTFNRHAFESGALKTTQRLAALELERAIKRLAGPEAT